MNFKFEDRTLHTFNYSLTVTLLFILVNLSPTQTYAQCALNSQFSISSIVGEDPNIYMRADGRFVVAYEAPDADGSGIYARLYDPSQAAFDIAFAVNQTTTLSQIDPKAFMLPNGNFVITWVGFDVSDQGVFARLFDANGMPLTNEFQVNTHTMDFQREASISGDANGNFIITWSSNNQEMGGGSTGVYAQRYNSSAMPVGPEFLVNTTIINAERFPQVAMAPNGSFVITWQSSAQDGDSEGVFARRFDVSGNPLSGEFQVNEYVTGIQGTEKIAMDGVGNFIIVWQSNGQDGDLGGIYAKRYASNGTVLQSEFMVNSVTVGYQIDPSVGMNANGDFVVSFTGNDGSLDGVFARIYNATGVPQGTEFIVNDIILNGQYSSAVDMADNGTFVVIWSGQLASDFGVGARAFRIPSLSAVLTQAGPCAAPVPGAINLTVTPAGSYFYQWSNGANTEDLSGLAIGTYTVTVSQDGGCSATASYAISCQSNPIPTLSQWGLLCLGLLLSIAGVSSLKYRENAPLEINN